MEGADRNSEASGQFAGGEPGCSAASSATLWSHGIAARPTGDLLVGADGVNSAVRDRLVAVAPTDTGV
ncbi:hypothetical protein [Streptomyces sp. WZ-12]|uniref:hypothetical protein n=1 Tax=Streptomyces sp. WZ-12 TaxID=3030210 RepID=UPI00238141E5|nr:hypothetical protein [Streptomyces sp. WZ-12]